MRDFLLVTAVIISSITALGRPAFGMLAFTCVSLLGPQSLTWGFGRTFPLAWLIAVGTIIGFLLWKEPKKFPWTRESLLLLALWALFPFTSLFAMYPTLAWLKLYNVSKILLMVFLSMMLINNERRLHLLMLVIAVSIGFHGLKDGIFSITTGGQFIVWGPEGTFLEANNAIGLAMAMNVSLLFYLLKAEKNRRLRWLLLAMFIFSYPAVICTFSRGAWLGLGANTLFILWKSRYRYLLIPASVIVLFLIIPYMPERVSNRYDELKGYEKEDSAQERFWSWEFCTRVGLSNPITGAGFDYYSLDAYERFFPEFLSRWPGKVWSCHSMWFTILGEHGLPGFIIWICLIACCTMTIRKIRSFGKIHQQDQWLKFSDMTTGAMIGYMVSGTFLDVAYFDLFYQLVAAVVIAKTIQENFLSQGKIEGHGSSGATLHEAAIQLGV
jgi:probable O-glycosylation ligase (exosortase A-associated)